MQLTTVPLDYLHLNHNTKTPIEIQLRGDDGQSFAEQNSVSEPPKVMTGNQNLYAKIAVRFLVLEFARPSPTAKLKAPHEGVLLIFGGGEGNRTPVRKPLDTTFSGCRVSIRAFPRPRRHSGSVLKQPFSA